MWVFLQEEFANSCFICGEKKGRLERFLMSPVSVFSYVPDALGESQLEVAGAQNTMASKNLQVRKIQLSTGVKI